MRRDPERLLKGPAEMIGAQVRELGQLGKRHWLRKVFLDVGRHDTLLPGGEPASDKSLAVCAALVDAYELVRKYSAECFEIGAIVGLRMAFDQRHKLLRRGEERGIIEEEARGEGLNRLAAT